jgi:response regulator RpfG family c-di-GMP phosphodiesterase
MRLPSPPASDAPHVLVVDDEPQIRDLLSSILQREGYAVTTRKDGPAGLEAVRAGRVDVVITDLKMPGMSGLDLIQEARRIRPELGSILITGYASTETAVEALRGGADDFVTKPFGVDQLRRVVERVLGARRMITQERDALDRAREEAEALRRRSREAEQALEHAQRDLHFSRRDLERRVRDLEFVGDLTSLLTREDDLQRILETTARILAARFQASGTRIEVMLEDGHHVAHHERGDVLPRRLAALAPELVARARLTARGVARDVVLGTAVPIEILAAPLTLGTRPGGGIALFRPALPAADESDLFLLSMVPRALAVAIEADLQRRAAVDNALRVATGILEALEGRGALHRGHASRVARLARAIATEMGLSPRLTGVIETAARLHDVGEVGVPDRLLQREGPLRPSERAVVETHAVLGARILAPFGEAAAFVRHHHERFDGRGYPDGLAGEEIPLGATIVGVAEAYDAITHRRPYRPSRSRAEAREEIARLKGVQFAPGAADALLALPAESL